MINESLSKRYSVAAAIEALLSLGCPPLPVAPQKDIKTDGQHRIVKDKDGSLYCPLDKDLQPIRQITGKNPSFLGTSGKAYPCRHGNYQDRLPTSDELKKFFGNSETGVGTLGGFDGIHWIDFDAKNFESIEACKAGVDNWITQNNLWGSWVEITGSGGYRVAVKLKVAPSFTNFSLESNGKHIGEVLGHGRFTVLAPSIHPNGNRYTRIGWGNPVEVEALDAIGIYPCKDETTEPERAKARTEKKAQNPNYGNASNPQANPYDIRNFAHYFDSYAEMDDGWASARCPHHNGESQRSFRVNLLNGAFKCHNNCPGKDVYKSGLALAVSQGHKPPAYTPNQQTPKGKSQKYGNSLSKITNQKPASLPQSTTFGILNPPLIASSPTQPLKDGLFKVLPVPKSVASCLTIEEKAPKQKRKWFETVLKRIKKVLLRNAKKEKAPRLGFKCFKEDNPDFEEKIRQVQRKLRSLSYEADIDLAQRYLPNELANQLPKSGLIGIKAPKGCGKSVLLKKIIALAKQQGIPVLSITPRIALGREQAIKWEITWIDDYGMMQTRAGDTSKQIAEVAKKMSEAKKKLNDLEKVSHQQLNLLDETETLNIEQQKADLRAKIEQYEQQIDNINSASMNTLALCWDSLWRTKDRDLKEGLIVIDEAELGLKHFISGATCRRNRPHLLKVFKDKLVECLMSGGRVILSDADLTDLAINYVREILPIPIKPFIVSNDYVGEETKWMVDLRIGSRGNTLSEIIEAIRDGAYLAITTDSQREAEALEERILQEFPDDFCAFLDADGKITDEAQARKKALIVRVDSTTTETEAGKAFIQKPNDQTLHWKPRILIYTPSMGVGVSIDETTQRWDEQRQEMMPYFDAVYGLFLGVIEPSQCRQQLARVRANVPRIVYCKESNKALEGCSSFFPAEVKNQTLKYSHSALNILDIARGVAGYEADDEEIRAAMMQLLNDAWDKDSRCWKEPSIDLASAFKARENYSLWNLANLLTEELQDEGHTVVLIQGVKTPLIEEMADIKDGKKAKVATLLANSSTMPLEEAKKVISTLGATKEQKLSAHKTLLQEELPEVNLTPEFVKKAVVDDHRRWLNQQRLFWYHSNLEAVKQIDTDHWLNNLKRFAEGTPFMRDIRSHAPKVDALRKSGIFEFINLVDCDRVYEGDTPEAEAFVKQCLRNKDDLQTELNVLVTKKSSPISLANRILGRVGLRLEKLTRSNKDNRWRLSADLVNDPDRINVLKAFELRWQMSQQEAEKKLGKKQAQPQSQQAIQTGGQSPYYIDQNIDRPPNFEGVSQGGNCLTLEVSVGQKSELEQLVERFASVDTADEFVAVIEGSSVEVVENAIASSDSQPRRKQLGAWLESISKPTAQDSKEIPIKPSGNALRGNRHCYIGQIAEILKTFKNYYETSLGSISRIEVERGNWTFV